MALASYPPSSFSFLENGLSEQLSRTMVYANLQPLEEHSPRVAPVAGGLLPHLLTLTAALAPRSRGRTTQRRLFSSALSRCRQRLPFSEAERSMLPGLSSRPLPLSLHQHHTSRCNRGLAENCEREKRASDKPGHCLTTCKSNKTFSFNKHLLRYIFYFEEGKSR